MFIFKNALRNISRSKVRNILVGIIVLVIAVSTCVALSIREAANEAKESTMQNLNITAKISVDRQSMMKNSAASGGTADMAKMKEAFSGASGLTIDEMLIYSKAASVKSFYYTLTSSFDETDSIKAISTTTSTTTSAATNSNASKNTGAPNMGGANSPMGAQGDFTVIGYSSDAAMTNFINGTCTITSGSIFTEGTSENICVISDELALYNSLKVGDSFKIVNPNNANETVELKICGIYNNSESTVTSNNVMGGFSASTDPANEIYMSYNALKAITTASSASASSTNMALASQVSGTYTFADVESYNNFDAECRALGLADTYTVSSSDVTSYEQSLQPIENLSKFATYFLLIVLLIGGIILIVLNIFNIRERKYEIGVLTAIGMKKRKVALQFISELFVVTFSCIIIGAGVGAAISVPVTNSLLASQVASAKETASTQTANFGRNSTGTGTNNAQVPNMPNSTTTGKNMPGAFASVTTNYISEVSSATNIFVILELMGIGILLTLVSSCSAVVSILRYEPLKILTNRD